MNIKKISAAAAAMFMITTGSITGAMDANAAPALGSNPNMNGQISVQGKPQSIPMAYGNPYNIKKGDYVQITKPEFQNKRGLNACKYGPSCSINRVVNIKVTDVQNKPNLGTVLYFEGFTGWKGHPIYKGTTLIGFTQGSNGGNGYAILFPTVQDAKQADKSKIYRPLGAVGLFHENDKNHYNPKRIPNPKPVNPVFGKNKPDPREAEFAKNNPKSFTKTGTNIARVKWDGSKVFHIDVRSDIVNNPGLSSDAWINFGSSVGSSSRNYTTSSSRNKVSAEDLWNEAVKLGVPDTVSLKQQFMCHAQGSAIRKDDWKLEINKPATTNQWGQVINFCNP